MKDPYIRNLRDDPVYTKGFRQWKVTYTRGGTQLVAYFWATGRDEAKRMARAQKGWRDGVLTATPSND